MDAPGGPGGPGRGAEWLRRAGRAAGPRLLRPAGESPGVDPGAAAAKRNPGNPRSGGSAGADDRTAGRVRLLRGVGRLDGRDIPSEMPVTGRGHAASG